MKTRVIKSVPLVKEVLQFYANKNMHSLQLQVMDAAQPVYPVLTVKDVAAWYKISHHQAKAILDDLVLRSFIRRKAGRYCRSELGFKPLWKPKKKKGVQ